jgi:arylsulfate sulfotransferase
MKILRFLLCAGALILSTLASVGCGSGNFNPPLTAVAATSHPLVAQYIIRHSHSGLTAWVEFGTDTTYGRKTAVMTDSLTTPGGHALNILVAGMLPRTRYHMRAHVDWAGGSWVDQDQTFTTGTLPGTQTLATSSSGQFAGISISAPFPGLTPAPGVELLSLVPPGLGTGTGPSIVQDVVTDIQGRIIWYCPLAGLPIKPMANGNYILNLGSDLREVDLTCNTVRDVSIAQVNQSLQAHGYTFPALTLFHHDMLTLPNGHWIALAQAEKDFTDLPGYPGTTSVQGDVLIDIDPNGDAVWAWSGFDHLDVNRHLFGLPDWTHSNALVYTSDGNLLLSMRGQSWIIKIDYANGAGSGNILWRLGQEGDFTLLGGDPSQWFYAQHDPQIVNVNGSQTSIAVYDDGNYRVDSSGNICLSATSVPPCYSRATIFQIDESTNLATLLWQDLPGLYTFWGGSIGILSNGDVEFDNTDPLNMPLSQIMEVTHTESPQIVWQMNVTGAFAYRGYRIPSLYPGVAWQ